MSKPSKLYKQRIINIQRVNVIRKLRQKKRDEGRKPSEIQPTHFDSLADKFLETVLKKKVPTNMCAHFLVAASNVHSFLLGHHTFEKSHAIFKTPINNKITGLSGEEAFLRLPKLVVSKHPFGIHPKIPWICATGDFIIKEDGDFICVEIKTFKSIRACRLLYDHLPIRVALQVWIQMEIFNLSKGQIYIYYLDRVGKRVTLYGKININRSASLFDSDLAFFLSVRYTEFLKDYFCNHNAFPSDDYFNCLKLRLSNNISLSLMGEKFDSAIFSKRLISRKLEPYCPYFDYDRVSLMEETEPRVPYHSLFKRHTFTSTSKLEKYFMFDLEYRREVWSSVSEKLTINTNFEIQAVKDKLTERPKTTDFLTKTQIETARPKKKIKKNLKEGRLIKTINRLKKLLHHKQAKIEALEAKLVAAKKQLPTLKASNTIDKNRVNNDLFTEIFANDGSKKSQQTIVTRRTWASFQNTKRLRIAK